MKWNWQLDDWPKFRYDASGLNEAEGVFLRQGGALNGAFKHLRPEEKQALTAEVLTSEALTTSAIEGEILDRESVRSSILRHLGINQPSRRIGPRERGISEMTLDVLRAPLEDLSDQTLFTWHRVLLQDQGGIEDVGRYRTHADPMTIASGPIGKETVHFEAPLSSTIEAEMSRFLAWFNQSRNALPPLTRAGIAHLYFESIHPFEDGNGRIGRAIAEMALAQGLGQASFTMLSTEIGARLSEYYAALEAASRSNEVTAWLQWFGEVVLAGQRRTQAWIDFLIAKTRMMDSLKGRINERQERALLRVFREGPDGFTGGLSAGNYQTITGAPSATAFRDLTQLVELGVLIKTGVGKGTRYWIKQDLA